MGREPVRRNARGRAVDAAKVIRIIWLAAVLPCDFGAAHFWASHWADDPAAPPFDACRGCFWDPITWRGQGTPTAAPGGCVLGAWASRMRRAPAPLSGSPGLSRSLLQSPIRASVSLALAARGLAAS